MKNKIYQYRYKILFFIITIVSLYVRFKFLSYQSNDYDKFLSKWFSELQQNGGVRSLGRKIGDYSVSYLVILSILTYIPIDSLYSIKLVSIIFDYICAIIVVMISKDIIKKKNEMVEALVYGIIVFLPTVVLNSSCWGQADSIYTAFILLSIYYLLKKKYVRSFIFLGVAFSFKLQTIFILPLYILIYLSKTNISIFNFMLTLGIYLITCIPAVTQGRSLWSCLGVYGIQISEYNNFLSLNFPNIWTLIYGFNNKEQYNCMVLYQDKIILIIGIANTMLIYLCMAIIVFRKKISFNKQKIIEFGLWSILIATFFLPCMHDRYLYVADILSWIYYLYNREKIYIPLSIQIISLSTYITYLTGYGGEEVYFRIISLIFLLIVIILTREIFINCIEKRDDDD